MGGILSYGVYIPRNRVKIVDIAGHWEKNGQEIQTGLGVEEKAIASVDEDSATMAVEASRRAINSGLIDTKKIKAVAVGSESHPYVVKPTATILGEFLGLEEDYLAVGTEFACKAATAAIQYSLGLIESGHIFQALVVGADTAQAKMGDALEYTAGSAAVSVVLGEENMIARILDFGSYSTNTLDFWRREGQKFPSHAGRFSGEPAYFNQVMKASKNLMEKVNLVPTDFDYVVFHMPNAKFPKEVAKRLGFSKEQLAEGLVVSQTGNPYSACAMLGLAAVLDIAKPKQKIFVCSYGSGSGSDAFVIETTDLIIKYQKDNRYKVKDQIKDKRYLSYAQVLKIMQGKGVLG